MTMKAKLKVILQADKTVVAESEDPQLWQAVLNSINTGKALVSPSTDDLLPNGTLEQDPQGGHSSPLAAFATEVGVSQAILRGACDPKGEAPFIHLDKHSWEALKKNTPERGSKSVSPIVLAATLLVLWKAQAGLDACIMSEARKVLATLQLKATNAARSVRNCEWLQLRAGTIVLNPAQTSKAISIAKAYCMKQPPTDE